MKCDRSLNAAEIEAARCPIQRRPQRTELGAHARIRTGDLFLTKELLDPKRGREFGWTTFRRSRSGLDQFLQPVGSYLYNVQDG